MPYQKRSDSHDPAFQRREVLLAFAGFFGGAALAPRSAEPRSTIDACETVMPVSNDIWDVISRMKVLSPPGKGPDIFILVSPVCRWCKFAWARTLPFTGLLRCHWIPIPLESSPHAYRLTAPLLGEGGYDNMVSTFLGMPAEAEITGQQTEIVRQQQSIADELFKSLCDQGAPSFFWKTKASSFYRVGLEADYPGAARKASEFLWGISRSAIAHSAAG